MKKLSLIIGLLCCVFVLAQEVKNGLRYAEFTKNDGSTFKAYLIVPKTPSGEEEMPGISIPYGKFEYRFSPDSKKEKIKGTDIKSVKILDKSGSEVIGYERIKLKAITTQGKLVEKQVQYFLPLIYDGKIKIYASSIIVINGGQYMYVSTEVAIRNQDSEFGILPVDYDRLNIFNFTMIDDKMFEALKFAGNNCKSFNQYLDELNKKQSEDKEFRKSILAQAKDTRKSAFGEAKERKLSGYGKQCLLGEKMLTFYVNFYGGIIREYEKNCK